MHRFSHFTQRNKSEYYLLYLIFTKVCAFLLRWIYIFVLTIKIYAIVSRMDVEIHAFSHCTHKLVIFINTTSVWNFIRNQKDGKKLRWEITWSSKLQFYSNNLFNYFNEFLVVLQSTTYFLSFLTNWNCFIKRSKK